MKLSKIAQLCKAAKNILLYTGNGEQWLGDGQAIYPLSYFPDLEAESFFHFWDIPENKQDDYICRTLRLPEQISTQDEYPGEEALEQSGLKIFIDGTLLTPLLTSQGTLYIDTRYLDPLPEGCTPYLRLSLDGRPYIAIKGGLLVKAIILPYKGITAHLAQKLKILANYTQAAAEIQGDEQPGQMSL